MRNILNYFRNKNTSASIAKERLQIIVSHQRVCRKTNELDLEKLQQEIIDLISRHLPIDANKVTIELDRDENRSILELNVVLPDSI
jgi:cell division topological specificity factor